MRISNQPPDPGPNVFVIQDIPGTKLGTPKINIIGVACSIVSDITNGKYNLLKWDKQERKYYPVEINLHGT